jgi:hypothetical protein
VAFDPTAVGPTPSSVAPSATKQVEEPLFGSAVDDVGKAAPQTSHKDKSSEVDPPKANVATSPSPQSIVVQPKVTKQTRPAPSMMSSKWGPQNAPASPATSQLESRPATQRAPTVGMNGNKWASSGVNTQDARHPYDGGRGGPGNGSKYGGRRYRGDGGRGGQMQRGRDRST